MKIFIANRNRAFTECLSFYLETVLSHEVIGMAANCDELEETNGILEADIILIEIDILNLYEIDTVKKALQDNPFLRFIAIVNHCEKTIALELQKAGVKACVLKPNIFEELETAIELAQNGQMYFSANLFKDTVK